MGRRAARRDPHAIRRNDDKEPRHEQRKTEGFAESREGTPKSW